MPPLTGFSDNAFATRREFRRAAVALLRALKPYHSPGGARIRLPLATGTHFDDGAAQLEGYARPLWAVATLLRADSVADDEHAVLIEPYIRGLANGTDPDHPEYWGPVVLRDQRMVEMEIISYALLAAPHAFFHSQTEKAQSHITQWLNTLNGKDFPTTNWLWFRVMTNLALVKVCGVPLEQLQSAMKEDLDLMEQFYLDEGWSADGIWSDAGRQADYYSGSFAIQFSQLIYATMAQDLDPERCEMFRARAREFATSFWRYFDVNGAAIPFGRSLTYRFAFAGFWSAVAFAELELPAPLNDWGVVKGLLLRHFRWWSTKQDVFNIDGALTIGFAYPNMYLSEDYNSAQSPYWAMKSFLALSLPEKHPFWEAAEKPLPPWEDPIAIPIRAPLQIICKPEGHHFLLSTGQYCPWPLKATEAKYGKFAYSSHFGFSVPTGPLIQQMAPDSALALSKDGGDTWRVPWKVDNPNFTTATLWSAGKEVESIPALQSTWRPWRDADVEVHTVLVAPCRRWPNTYLRLHTIVSHENKAMELHTVQGGFAIQSRGATRGEVLPAFTDISGLPDASQSFPEFTVQTSTAAMISSDAGASGVNPLKIHSGTSESDSSTRGEALKPDANTNLIWQRTLIPTLRDVLTVSKMPAIFGCAVFALARTADRAEQYKQLDVAKLWSDVPVVVCGTRVPDGVEEYIRVDSMKQ